MKGTGSDSHHQKQVEVLVGRTKEGSPSIKLLYFIEVSLNSFELPPSLTQSVKTSQHQHKTYDIRLEIVGLNGSTKHFTSVESC